MNPQLAASQHQISRAVVPFQETRRDIAGPEIRFGRFRAVPGARRLFSDGQPVEIGSRAFDLLIVLLRGRGTVVSKAEIMSHVWPSTLVDESNLRFQMAALRRALGEERDIIKTIPGRGYLLAVESAAALDAVVLPCVKRGAPIGPQGEPEPGTRPSRPVVLIIEDDQKVRETLQGLFRSAGFQVETFTSVEEFVSSKQSGAA